MSVAVPIRSFPYGRTTDPKPWLDDLRARYGRLAAAAPAPGRALELARLGGKLAELVTLAAQEAVEPRDAALLPLLAAWVTRRLEELEGDAERRPLPFPLAPPPDEHRARALLRAAALYRRAFGTPPTPAAMRRMDSLLARYPLPALAEALQVCARREGRIHWTTVEAILVAGGAEA